MLQKRGQLYIILKNGNNLFEYNRHEMESHSHHRYALSYVCAENRDSHEKNRIRGSSILKHFMLWM